MSGDIIKMGAFGFTLEDGGSGVICHECVIKLGDQPGMSLFKIKAGRTPCFACSTKEAREVHTTRVVDINEAVKKAISKTKRRK